ncbi:MAG TPA: polymer-forming cytoskeletal protein [Gemmatimonadales bacterium]
MGFFSATAVTTETTPFVERRRNGGAPQGLSIIAKDLTIAGDLHAAGVIRIEGRVIGNVHSGDQVLLTDGGIIEGDVVCREAVIGGRVHGSINGEERIELQATAMIHGDIVTRRLLIQEGSTVNGAVKMESVSVVEPALVTAGE